MSDMSHILDRNSPSFLTRQLQVEELYMHVQYTDSFLRIQW